MISDPSAPLDIGAALGALPLFPLPQAVLFPGALMPLHVFEPRYKAMIRDCLGSHRALAVVQITDVHRLDSHRHPQVDDGASGRDERALRPKPQIARVAGAGLIIDHAELSEGRFNILVRGVERVALEELAFVAPYRTARADILASAGGAVPERDVTALLSNAAAFVALVREQNREFDFRLPGDAPPGALADICAHHLLIDASDRQAVLELLDLPERVLRVTEILALQRLALGRGGREQN